MGNCEFKDNGVPIPRTAGVVPKTIIGSAEKILNKLWSDEDISSSKCVDVEIFDFSEKKSDHLYPFTLLVEFKTILPYLEKTRVEMIGTNYFKWNTRNPPSNLPKEIIKQCNFISQLLDNKNLYMQESPRGDWCVLIELVPLSEKEKEVENLKKEVEDLKTHIACMPGGPEYLEVKKHWEENTK